MNRQLRTNNGETAVERQHRREALLAYGHLFAEAYRQHPQFLTESASRPKRRRRDVEKAFSETENDA